VTSKPHRFYCDWVVGGPCNGEGAHFYICKIGIGDGEQFRESYVTMCDKHDNNMHANPLVEVIQEISREEFLVHDLMEQ